MEDRSEDCASTKRQRVTEEEEMATAADPRQVELMRLREDNRRLVYSQGLASGSTDLLAELAKSPLAGIPTSQLLALFPRQSLPSLSSVLPSGSAAASMASLPLPDRLLAAEAALARERARTQDPPGSRFTEARLADGMNTGTDPFLGWGLPQGMGGALMRHPAAAAGVAMSPPSMRHTTPAAMPPAAGATFVRSGPTIEQLIGLDRVSNHRIGETLAQGWPTFPTGALAPSGASGDPNELRILAAYLAGRDHEQQHQQRMQRAALSGRTATEEAETKLAGAKRTHSRMAAATPPASAPVAKPAPMPTVEAPPEGPPPKYRKVDPQPLYLPSDDEDLSEYQCLVRKQIEAFQAEKDATATSTRGRNRPIVWGQVGIRCRHCKDIASKDRQRAALYYPSKLDRLYQMSQTIASLHLADHCQHIPSDIRSELSRLREAKSAALGGKKYWADAGAAMGLVEHDKRIFYGEKASLSFPKRSDRASQVL